MSGEEYRRAMDTLARETRMPPESAARIEQQILNAFASHDAADAVTSPRKKSFVRLPRTGSKPITATWRPWVPAAAAIVLVAGALFVLLENQPRVNWAVPPRTAEKSPPAPAVVPTIEQPPAVEVRATHPPSPDRKPPKKANVVTPSGFVDLPWTAGLPAFESGEIVRMEVPVASLPTYGIDISSGAGKGPVEADVLIGQDGFARAIRLVTTTSRSTQ
jgi:hypothetical protein